MNTHKKGRHWQLSEKLWSIIILKQNPEGTGINHKRVGSGLWNIYRDSNTRHSKWIKSTWQRGSAPLTSLLPKLRYAHEEMHMRSPRPSREQAGGTRISGNGSKRPVSTSGHNWCWQQAEQTLCMGKDV